MRIDKGFNGLLLFFLYVFPFFFFFIPTPPLPSVVDTSLLVLGVVLWLFQTVQVYRIIRSGPKAAKQLQELQRTGVRVKAEVIESRTIGEIKGLPSISLRLRFNNLAGYPVEAVTEVLDSKPWERRFEPGKSVELKLNRNGFSPAFTIASSNPEGSTSVLGWLWFVFSLVYPVALLMASNFIQGQMFPEFVQHDGGVWSLLTTPSINWLMGSIIGIFVLKSFRWIAAGGFLSSKSSDDSGELLLHGIAVPGEVIDYWQTGMYINEQPMINFEIQYQTLTGELVRKSHRQVVLLTELHTLKKGPVEVHYLPNRAGAFDVTFLEDTNTS